MSSRGGGRLRPPAGGSRAGAYGACAAGPASQRRECLRGQVSPTLPAPHRAANSEDVSGRGVGTGSSGSRGQNGSGWVSQSALLGGHAVGIRGRAPPPCPPGSWEAPAPPPPAGEGAPPGCVHRGSAASGWSGQLRGSRPHPAPSGGSPRHCLRSTE